MSPRTLAMTDPLIDYVRAMGVRESDVARRLREETLALPEARMLTAPEQAQLLALLVAAVGARTALEIGVFTGYSALWMAAALPADGRLIAIDRSAQWTDVARRYWAEAGVAERIDLRLGTALDVLAGLDLAPGSVDFAYVDADKANYDAYYERVLTLLRPGGLIGFDNMLWSGRVADPAVTDDDTAALRHLAAKIHGDPRVTCCLVPVGDGLMLVRKQS